MVAALQCAMAVATVPIGRVATATVPRIAVPAVTKPDVQCPQRLLLDVQWRGMVEHDWLVILPLSPIFVSIHLDQ